MFCYYWKYLVTILFIVYVTSVLTAHLFYLSERINRQKFSFYKEIKSLLTSNKISYDKSYIYAKISIVTWALFKYSFIVVVAYLILKIIYCE